MITLSQIREQKADLIERYQKRMADLDVEKLLDQVLELDEQRKSTQQKMDDELAEANQIAKQIGQLFKEGKQEEAGKMKSRAAELKQSSGSLKESLQKIEDQQREILFHLPNVPQARVPKGKDDSDNEITEEFGTKHSFSFEPKPHWELADEYDLIDFELGVKISGAGFPVYKGKGAKLQRALINFFLDEAEKAGYAEVIPPHLVNEASGIGTGQLPDKDAQMYHVGEDGLYLIPTAEVPVTNIYRDVILKEDQFPIKNCAYSPCFRREAGSYGKDVRGLNRLHQFDKVEIVRIEKPENSDAALEEMKSHVQGLLNKLGLQSRILLLCGGDLGFAAAVTYDFEVYSAAQERWLEVSSVSNFESFQANRLKLRYKNEDGKSTLAHTLNGSALALPRILAALLENYQQEDHIAIPDVLKPYLNFDKIEK
ncbi:MAG: serine--tRNA ligase [Flavobacteriales bacterium]|nr:serine--tRNA ligase [Flavobacteriales bacterium]